MQFKDRLRMLRKEKKLTQIRLGQMLNYGYTAIANYESGRNHPSIEDLKKIAKIFNVSMDYLLCVNDIRYPYVRDDNSNEFNEVRRYYAKLTPKKIEELLFFMDWLVARPEEDEEEQLTGKTKKAEKTEQKQSEESEQKDSPITYAQPQQQYEVLQVAESPAPYYTVEPSENNESNENGENNENN